LQCLFEIFGFVNGVLRLGARAAEAESGGVPRANAGSARKWALDLVPHPRPAPQSRGQDDGRRPMPEADEIDRAPFRDADQALGLHIRNDLLGNFGLRRRCALRSGWRSRNDSQENQSHARKKRSGVAPRRSPAIRNAALDLWAFILGRYAISIHADEISGPDHLCPTSAYRQTGV